MVNSQDIPLRCYGAGDGCGSVNVTVRKRSDGYYRCDVCQEEFLTRQEEMKLQGGGQMGGTWNERKKRLARQQKKAREEGDE